MDSCCCIKVRSYGIALVLLVVSFASGFSSTTPPATNLLPSANNILFDVPVSNNGARCRIIAYKVGTDEICYIDHSFVFACGETYIET